MGNEASSQSANPRAVSNSAAPGASGQGQIVSSYSDSNQAATQSGQQANTVSTLKTNVAATLHKGWVKSKEASAKAVSHSKRLANRTDNIPELLLLANEELATHVQIRADTSVKVDAKSKYFDSFRDPRGIIYVTGWSVGLGTFGGSYRRGFMMRRFAGGEWSLPFAIQEFEGSAGLQLKATIDTTWYVVKSEQEMKAFTDGNNLKLGAGAQLALGSAGVTTQADLTVSKESVSTTEDVEEKGSTNASMGSAKGFAIGASVHGGTFQGYKKANERFYCQGAKKMEVLGTGLNSKEAFDLLAGHPNMPDVKNGNLAIVRQFVSTVNELIAIESQREGAGDGNRNQGRIAAPTAPAQQAVRY